MTATREFPRRLRRHRPQPAERVPRHPPRARRRRVRRPRRPRRRAPEGIRARRGVAVGRSAGGANRHARSGALRDLLGRSPGLRRPDDGVPRPARRGRPVARGGDPAASSKDCPRGTAGRTRRSGPPPPPAEFKPPDGAPGRTASRCCASASTTRRRSWRSCRSTASASALGGARGTLLARDRTVAGEHREDLHLRTRRTARTARGVPSRIVADLARRAFRRPVTAGAKSTAFVAPRAPAQQEEGSFAEGLAVGIQALLVSPDFLFRHRARPPRAGGAPASRSTSWRRGCRISCGRACRTRSCARAADAGRLREPAGAGRRRCAACCAIRKRARSPSTSAASGCSSARSSRSRAIASASPTSRTTCASRCAAKRSSSSSTSSGTIAASSTSSTADTRSSTSGWRGTTASTGVSGPEFRRVDLAGSPRGGVVTHAQRAHRLVLRHADVAGAARQVDPRQPAQRATAGAAARRPEPGRGRRSARRPRMRAAARGAPQEPDLRVLPPPHGSARLRARELRRRRRLAHDGRQVPGGRLGHAAGRADVQRARRSCGPS